MVKVGNDWMALANINEVPFKRKETGEELLRKSMINEQEWSLSSKESAFLTSDLLEGLKL